MGSPSHYHHRRQPSPTHHFQTSKKCTLFSLFVDNIHEDLNHIVLWKYFKWAGEVKDIYIPKRQKENRRGKFGFVRFSDPREAEHVALKCNGDYLWGRRLVVKEALFGGVPNYHSDKYFNGNKYSTKPHFIPNNNGRDFRSYQEALNGPISTHYQAFVPKENDNEASNSQKKPNLQYVPKESETEWLAGCAVGYLQSPVSLTKLKDIFVGLGLQNCSMTPMGGNMVLLAFQSKNEMETNINLNLQGLELWFDCIKPWDDDIYSASRFVWLKCEGIPLHAWNLSFFSLIGGLCGKFIKVDRSTDLKLRLDVARILVLTSYKEKINKNSSVLINGKAFDFSFMEDESTDFLKDEVLLSSNGDSSEGFTREDLGHSIGLVQQRSHESVEKIPLIGSDLHASDHRADFRPLVGDVEEDKIRSHQSSPIQISNSNPHNSLPNFGTNLATSNTPDLSQSGQCLSPLSRVQDSLSPIHTPKRTSNTVDLSKAGPILVGPSNNRSIDLEIVLPFSFRPNDSCLSPRHNLDDNSQQDKNHTPSPSSSFSERVNFLENKLNSKLGKDKRRKRSSRDNNPLIFGRAGRLIKINAKVASKTKGKGISVETKNPSGGRSRNFSNRKQNPPLIGPFSRSSNISESLVSPSDDGSKIRKKLISKEAHECWDLGKKLGLYVSGNDSDGVNIMEDLETRDWDEFERRQNE